MINERENKLVFVITMLIFSGTDEIDFDQSFFKVSGDLALDFVITMIFTLIFYKFATKPLYKWVVNNSK